MSYIARSELNRMSHIILDEETGMTALDYWEWSHPYDDVVIIEDEEPEFQTFVFF